MDCKQRKREASNKSMVYHTGIWLHGGLEGNRFGFVITPRTRLFFPGTVMHVVMHHLLLMMRVLLHRNGSQRHVLHWTYPHAENGEKIACEDEGGETHAISA